ncbi:MAG: hypothetical protein ACRCVX_16195 [Shewanella sp.]
MRFIEMGRTKYKHKMRNIYIVLALIFGFVSAGFAQNKINAHQIGKTMGTSFGSPGAILTLDSLNNRANWVQSALSLQTSEVSGSFSASQSTGTIIVNALAADAIIMLPLCNAALHGRTVWVEKQGGDLFAAQINIPSGNTWRYGTNKWLYGQGTVGKCTCTFISGSGQWAFSAN